MVPTVHDKIRFRLTALSVVYLLNAVAGTWLAICRGLPGSPFGLRTGFQVGSDFAFGLGTALSVPLVLLLTLVALNWWMVRTSDLRAAKWIGILVWVTWSAWWSSRFSGRP